MRRWLAQCSSSRIRSTSISSLTGRNYTSFQLHKHYSSSKTIYPATADGKDKNGGLSEEDLNCSNDDCIDSSISSSATTNFIIPKVVFFSNVYPDPSASAAGVRTQFFLEQMSSPYQKNDDSRSFHAQSVYYATGASSTSTGQSPSNEGNEKMNNKSVQSNRGRRQVIQDELLEKYKIPVVHVPPNDSKSMKDFWDTILPNTHSLVEDKPSSDLLVIFDRFYSEEAYSFAIREQIQQRRTNGRVKNIVEGNDDTSPTFVLDMQDMHSLRWGRQQVVQQFDKKIRTMRNNKSYDPLECLDLVMEYRPTVSNNPHLLRELASIHRCDLTWVCSPYEMQLLKDMFQIPERKLSLVPFFVQNCTALPLSEADLDSISHEGDQSISEQSANFVFCGGFLHAPNVDAVHVLLQHVWPRIRKKLPTSSLHIHGAFCPPSILNQHNPLEGVYIHGFTESLDDIFSTRTSSKRKILLAPLRFGAGIKGKIVDAWRYGMPVVTTPVGSEGMVATNLTPESNQAREHSLFGGLIASNLHEFCEMAISMADDEALFQEKKREGTRALSELYGLDRNLTRWNLVLQQLNNTMENVGTYRESDIFRSLLWHQTARSTEYFSRWIELKETINTNAQEVGKKS